VVDVVVVVRDYIAKTLNATNMEGAQPKKSLYRTKIQRSLSLQHGHKYRRNA